MSPKRLMLVPPLAAMAFLLLTFQNCAKNLASEEVETEIDAFQAAHVDREHGTIETMSKIEIEARSEDLMSDRVLLMAQLEAVYGPSVATYDGDSIRLDMTVFGSPCSLYEYYTYEVKKADGTIARPAGDANRPCSFSNTASVLKATTYPQASVVRQGIMGQLCLKLSTTALPLKFALAQIDAKKIPEPTPENVLKAFRLFYRNSPQPPDTLIASLQVMMPGISDERPTEAIDWSPVLHTICISSGWQLL